MKFDQVFDVQKAFRKVMNAFAYPGTIYSLKDEAQGFEQHWACYDATRILMYMLLDADTSFAIDTKQEELSAQFTHMTYCPLQPKELAQYVFVTREHDASMKEIIEAAKTGTLENPQLGATLIIEVEALSEQGNYCLSGPGLKANCYKGIECRDEWLIYRNDKNAEFPLGIDIILVDQMQQVMALPRTTRVERSM